MKQIPIWLPLGVADQKTYSFDSTTAAIMLASYTITHFGKATNPLVRVNRLGPGIPDHPLRLLRIGNQAFLQEFVLPPVQRDDSSSSTVPESHNRATHLFTPQP